MASSDDKQMNSVFTTVLLVLLGLVLVYLGVGVLRTSLAVITSDDGPMVAGIALGAIGVAMVLAPVLVTLSQVRALLRRRRS
ncbi:MAG TPA: hypothetical protein VLA97_06930 [Nocardioidaceae bacterium]|nr:hypothetical protein [Nocardioidaceae bacterium]